MSASTFADEFKDADIAVNFLYRNIKLIEEIDFTEKLVTMMQEQRFLWPGEVEDGNVLGKRRRIRYFVQRMTYRISMRRIFPLLSLFEEHNLSIGQQLKRLLEDDLKSY